MRTMFRSLLAAALTLTAVVEVSAAERPVWAVSTLAGRPGVAGMLDGDAHLAIFNRPTWLDVVKDGDLRSAGLKGDLYVVDRANQAVRRISHGSVTTLQISIASFDRAGRLVNFDGPFGGGIAIEPPGGGCGSGPYDRGIWFANSGTNEIPLVTFGGVIAARDDRLPLVGSGSSGTANGNSITAQFSTPTGLALSVPYPNFNSISRRFLYIADTANHTIRRVRFILSFEACPQPWTVETFAGAAGQPGWSDANGTAAQFNQPRGLATSANGDVYVADSGNHAIRRIDTAGNVTTVAGVPGEAGSDDGLARSAHLNTPSGLDFDAEGNLLIADTGNHTIRMLTTDGELVTLAGLPGVAGYHDGVSYAARFAGPVGIRALSNGTIVVADTSNNAIRLLTPVVPADHRRAVGR